MTEVPEAKKWRKEAKDFESFKEALREELDSKPDGSEWTVHMEVKKVGNPIHDYRIVLRPGG